MGPDLNAARRERELAELTSETVDVLVIGGGVTGAGVALDAASRGLSVALLERDDLAFGTSRWSSKLVHGGLRYLASGQFGVAHESAQERAHLMNAIAPHLVHPMAQVLPVFADSSKRDVALSALGFGGGHLLAKVARTGGVLKPPRWIGRDRLRDFAPGLRVDGLRGGLVAFDGQLEDDARLVVAIARTAASFGARVSTRCAVESVAHDGVVARDGLSGEVVRVPARHVVNATGVWAGELDASVSLAPSRGTHVVVRSELLAAKAAILAPVPGQLARFVFALPQPDGLSFVGITDVEETARPVPRVPEPSAQEVDWILSVLARVVERPLRGDEIVGAFAGLRPLVAAGASDRATADISRRHLVRRSGNLVTVTGGKLTTYRRMAQDTVDLITDTPCRTREIALVGAGHVGVGPMPERLVRRFGSEAARVAALADGDPTLLEQLAPGIPVMGVEVVHAVQHEGALDVDDVLERRTRLSLVPADAAAARARVEQILATL